MLHTFRKILNITTFFFLVIASIACGIWGFFNIEILPTLLGSKLSKTLYYIIGFLGLYGVHLFIEYAKIQLKVARQSTSSEYNVEEERSYEE